MSDWLTNNGEGSDGLGHDPQLMRALEALDPALDDPNYWLRFRGWVMTGAARELARRRLIAELTVGDVMSSWARTLVPTAVLAAAVAATLLVRAPTAPPAGPLVLEELLLEEQLLTEIPGETIPVLLAPDGTEGVVAFATETF